jgi:hypothetical protein
MASHIERRKFLATPMRRIGVLMHLAADDPEGQRRVAAFLQGLQELSAGMWTSTCDGPRVRPIAFVDTRWKS